jgi:hypothetical protein
MGYSMDKWSFNDLQRWFNGLLTAVFIGYTNRPGFIKRGCKIPAFCEAVRLWEDVRLDVGRFCPVILLLIRMVSNMVLTCFFFNHGGYMILSSGWWFGTCFIFHFIYGMSSFPLTNSYFSRWLLHHQPDLLSTRNGESIWSVEQAQEMCAEIAAADAE